LAPERGEFCADRAAWSRVWVSTLSRLVFPAINLAHDDLASINGRISWHLPDGRTYADWEESQTADAGLEAD